MTKSLIIKALVVVLAVVLLQIAVAPDTQAQSGWGGGQNGFYYKVHYGDTLFAICRKFGVDPYEIARVNGLPNPNHIYAGQVLYIPSGSYCETCGGGWYPQPRPRPQPSGCYNNCYSHQPVQYHGCGNNCSGQGYQGCGNNCNWQGNQGCGNDCNWQGNQGCGNNCYQQGYGYDYTGYYYDGNYSNNYQRYSYTCGYNYNCY